MGKPISGVDKLPFGLNGINVQGAILANGTKLTNVRLFKQRSSSLFDIIDADTNTVHRKLKITGTDTDGNLLLPDDTNTEVLNKINNGTLFIRTYDEDAEPTGYVLKMQSNFAFLSNGLKQFIPDYAALFAVLPDPTDPVLTPNGTASFVTSTGNNLRVGTGNSAEHMVITDDGILEVALAIRHYHTGPVVTPVNGTYTIPLGDGENWTFAASVGIQNPEFVGYITDLYNLTLVLFGDSTGLETYHNLTLYIVRDGDSYVIQDGTGQFRITDSYVSPNKKVVQNIGRYSNITPIVFPAIPFGSVPFGKFKVKLIATHIPSGKVMENSVFAEITHKP